MSSLDIRSTARSHIGSVRTVNEDRILNCEERRLWAIADGMGGHSRGDVAAELAVSTLGKLAGGTEAITILSIDAAIRRANDEIFAANETAGSQSGATIAGLSVDDTTAVVFWAGDSRVYRRRSGVTSLLTRDDRVVQDMIDAGVIDARQARRHPSATVITRAIGATEKIEVTYRQEQLDPGDIFLICSDGLSDLVEQGEIEEALAQEIDPAAASLVRGALVRGGTDNISLIIVRIDASTEESTVVTCQTPLHATRF